MYGFKVILDVHTVNYASRVDLDKTQHHISEACDEAEWDHVDVSENYDQQWVTGECLFEAEHDAIEKRQACDISDYLSESVLAHFVLIDLA